MKVLPEEVHAMGRREQEIVRESFSAETMPSAVLDVYQEVLQRG